MFNLDKGDIAIVVIGGERKLLRLLEAPGENLNSRHYVFKFDKMWDMILQPARRGNEMALDRGFVPVSQAMDMVNEGYFMVPMDAVITVSKLNPDGRDYKELSAEAAGITLA